MEKGGGLYRVIAVKIIDIAVKCGGENHILYEEKMLVIDFREET